jgi:glycyl-tRNA synthetase beta chain
MEFFLEVGTEELPASVVSPALQQLAELVKKTLTDARIAFGDVQTFATPRRLGVVLSDVAASGEEKVEEVTGPPVRIAFDGEGNPKVPAQKFAEKVGLTVEELKRVETPKGEYLAASVTEKGAITEDLLNEQIPAILARLHFPKSMRWGAEPTPFSRPIQWLCALLGGKTLDFAFAGVNSGNQSCGHRFLAPEFFEVQTLAQYKEAMADKFVVLSTAERRKVIAEEGQALAKSVGGQLWEDEEIIDLNVQLVEYPEPIMGSFEEKYLALPKEVLRTSMRHHLKCFTVVNDEGELLPHFVAISGLKSKNPQTVVGGYQRVLRARLSDASFFYNEDHKHTLATRTQKLDSVIFQSKLGSYGDKVRRLEALSTVVSEAVGHGDIADHALRAAHLCKADLLTGMVGEFPTLQGIMGRYYALHDGEAPEVAEALFEQYLPAGQDDPVPASPTGLVLALCDRLDTLVGGFAVGLKPTGSADPYGLRRQTIGILRILREHKLPAPIRPLLEASVQQLGSLVEDPEALLKELMGYTRTRLVQQLQKDGWARDLVDAVCVPELLATQSLPALEVLLQSLQEAVDNGVLKGLAYTFQRVNNILKPAAKKKLIPAYFGLGATFFREQSQPLDASLFVEPAEKALLSLYLEVHEVSVQAFGQSQFSDALNALLQLQAPIDTFFDNVMVMDKDEAVRDRRLHFLRQIARLAFVDFSRIQTEESS